MYLYSLTMERNIIKLGLMWFPDPSPELRGKWKTPAFVPGPLSSTSVHTRNLMHFFHCTLWWSKYQRNPFHLLAAGVYQLYITGNPFIFIWQITDTKCIFWLPLKAVQEIHNVLVSTCGLKVTKKLWVAFLPVLIVANFVHSCTKAMYEWKLPLLEEKAILHVVW